MKTPIDFYLYAYGNAAGNSGCELGAVTLKHAIEKMKLQRPHQWHAELKTPHRQQQHDALPDVAQLCGKLAADTQRSFLNQHFFMALGGDHSMAIGSWSGASVAAKGDLGLIWFDAHMDAHTFNTTPSHNIHGMPLAVLLGYGEPALTHLLTPHPKLKPENVVIVGARSYESDEVSLLQKLGVRVFYMEEVRTMGIENVLQAALSIVTHNTQYFGISVDLDGFDPEDAPGVGSPANNGIPAAEFLAAFPLIAKHPQLIGADIAEFNPGLDVDHKTENLAVSLCKMMLMQNR